MREMPPELRDLFAQESGIRLARLAQALLRLEDHADDTALVDEVFRDAHSLKGSAAMMGYHAFSRVAHRMEDLLEGVRSGGQTPTSELVDALLAGVDGLREVLDGVVAGEDRTAELAELEHRVSLVEPAPEHEPALAPGPAPTPAPAPPTPTRPAAPGRRREEAVRVPLARMDELARLSDDALAGLVRLTSDQGAQAHADQALRLWRTLGELHDVVRAARLVPLASITEPLQRAVRDVARTTGKSVRWVVEGGETELDQAMLDQLADPLLHLVRNAVDHGVEVPDERLAAGKPAEATVRLHAEQVGPEVRVTVSDDGRGIDVASVRAQAGGATSLTDEAALDLIFRPGLSTNATVTEVSGRGVGLDVVRAHLAALRGSVTVHSAPGRGTEFRITVPISLSVVPSLVVRAGGQPFAIPIEAVAGTFADEGGATFDFDGDPLPVARLADTLGFSPVVKGEMVVLSDGVRRAAFRVGGVEGHRDVIVTGLPASLPRSKVVAGTAIEADGSILLVLDVPGLLARVAESRPSTGSGTGGRAAATHPGPDPAAQAEVAPAPPPRLVVVDDDTTLRGIVSTWLRRAGYEVRTATDGADGLALLRSWPADLALLDIEMPVMDGLSLTLAIREDPVLRGLAVLILTSLASEEDRRRGMDVGADGYLVKGTFDEEGLLAAVARLLGREP